MSRIRHTGLEYGGQLGYPTAQQAMTAAGAVSLNTYSTAVDTTSGSGHASTLGKGSFTGQLKKVHLVVDGGDLVLTIAQLAGGNTYTFADVGDYVLLQWDGVRWVPIDVGNQASGDAGPVLSTV